jgi:TRAP transporter TAXI family solute receptor
MLFSGICIAAQSSSKSSNWPKDIPFGCKSKGGTYIAATSISEMINKYVPGVNAHPATYVTDSVFPGLLKKGEIVLGTGIGPSIIKPSRGMDEYAGKRHVPGLRTAMIGDNTYYLVVASRKSDIKTVADIKGKRLMAQKGGSIAFNNAWNGLLKSYDIPKKKVKILTFTQWSDLSNAIREGKTEAVATYATLAASWLQDLMTTGDGSLISWGDENMDKMSEYVLGFIKGEVPANTYKGQEAAVATPVTPAYYNCHESLPDDLVYAITAAVYDHFDEFKKYFALAKKFELPSAISPDRMLIPIHNGAIKYYKEKGFWTPAHEARQKKLLMLSKGK